MIQLIINVRYYRNILQSTYLRITIIIFQSENLETFKKENCTMPSIGQLDNWLFENLLLYRPWDVCMTYFPLFSSVCVVNLIWKFYRLMPSQHAPLVGLGRERRSRRIKMTPTLKISQRVDNLQSQSINQSNIDILHLLFSISLRNHQYMPAGQMITGLLLVPKIEISFPSIF